MPFKTALIMILLTLASLLGVGVSYLAQPEWVLWVFWGSANLIPATYIALAWWGAQGQDTQTEDFTQGTETFDSTTSHMNSHV